MKISQVGLDLIKKYEGYRDKSYLCPAGVWTIGYGTTVINGKPVRRGMVCNKEQAQEWLENDANRFLESIERLIREDVELNQNQIDSLASFVYNVGIGNFKKSTLLKQLNEGFNVLAAEEFKRWNKGGGRVLGGLVDRRAEEARLFTSGINYSSNTQRSDTRVSDSDGDNSFLGQ